MRMEVFLHEKIYEVPQNVAEALYDFMQKEATTTFHPNGISLFKGDQEVGEIRLGWDTVSGLEEYKDMSFLSSLNGECFEGGPVPGITPK